MNNGMVSFDEVMPLAYEQVANPRGILSIFSGGVFWESVEQFEQSCAQDPEHAIDRLLEVRVYSGDCEFHAVRDSIDESRFLSWRTVFDDDYESFDDEHYLDIDEQRSNASEGFYQTMSGGAYSLPINNARKIRVRNYLDFDLDGLAHAVDFRIVDLLREGDA